MIYQGKDLERCFQLAVEANRMVTEDTRKFRDNGSCVLGAGIAIYGVKPRHRKSEMLVLVNQPFQGNVSSFKACERALEWMRSQGIDAFWYDGRLD